MGSLRSVVLLALVLGLAVVPAAVSLTPELVFDASPGVLGEGPPSGEWAFAKLPEQLLFFNRNLYQDDFPFWPSNVFWVGGVGKQARLLLDQVGKLIQLGSHAVLWRGPDASELWGTTGTPGRVQLLGSFSARQSPVLAAPLTWVQTSGALGALFWVRSDPGGAFWWTDGTRGGTRKLLSIRRQAEPEAAWLLGDRVVWRASGVLWSGRSGEAPVPLKRSWADLGVWQGSLFFSSEGWLYSTDGTRQGTQALLRTPPDEQCQAAVRRLGSSPLLLVAYPDRRQEIWALRSADRSPRRLVKLDWLRPNGCDEPNPSPWVFQSGDLWYVLANWIFSYRPADGAVSWVIRWPSSTWFWGEAGGWLFFRSIDDPDYTTYAARAGERLQRLPVPALSAVVAVGAEFLLWNREGLYRLKPGSWELTRLRDRGLGGRCDFWGDATVFEGRAVWFARCPSGATILEGHPQQGARVIRATSAEDSRPRFETAVAGRAVFSTHQSGVACPPPCENGVWSVGGTALPIGGPWAYRVLGAAALDDGLLVVTEDFQTRLRKLVPGEPEVILAETDGWNHRDRVRFRRRSGRLDFFLEHEAKFEHTYLQFVTTDGTAIGTRISSPPGVPVSWTTFAAIGDRPLLSRRYSGRGRSVLLWEPGSEAVEVVVEDLGYGCEGTGQELSGGWYLFAGTESFWLVGPDRQVRKVPTRQPNYFCDSPGVIAFDDDPRGPSALLLVDERDDEGLEWTILYRTPVPDGPLEALASWRKNALSISPVGRGPGVAFLRAHDEPHGNEVWRTDGTPEGTHLWLDVLPGRASSEPSDLLPVAGGYVFAAHSPAAGRELWFSDGTAGGTRRLTDLAPGPLSSFPKPLVFDDSGDLLFTADDASYHGYELWRIRELDPP